MFTKTLMLAGSIAGALALPDVVIKPLPAGCASYPNYNAETKSTGTLTTGALHSENTAIEGAGFTTRYSLAIGSQGPVMRWGYVNLNRRIDIARNPIECVDDTVNIFTQTTVNAAGAPGDYEWTPLVLSPYPYDAILMYLVEGEQPTLYEHYIDGVKQEGVYMGGFNTTTWGVQWRDATGPENSFPSYYLRLLPEGQTLNANETRTFLAVLTPPVVGH